MNNFPEVNPEASSMVVFLFTQLLLDLIFRCAINCAFHIYFHVRLFV